MANAIQDFITSLQGAIDAVVSAWDSVLGIMSDITNLGEGLVAGLIGVVVTLVIGGIVMALRSGLISE